MRPRIAARLDPFLNSTATSTPLAPDRPAVFPGEARQSVLLHQVGIGVGRRGRWTPRPSVCPASPRVCIRRSRLSPRPRLASTFKCRESPLDDEGPRDRSVSDLAARAQADIAVVLLAMERDLRTSCSRSW